MKNTIQIAALFVLIALFASCEAVAGIFKAGMGFGIFLVLLVIGIILFFVFKGRNK